MPASTTRDHRPDPSDRRSRRAIAAGPTIALVADLAPVVAVTWLFRIHRRWARGAVATALGDRRHDRPVLASPAPLLAVTLAPTTVSDLGPRKDLR